MQCLPVYLAPTKQELPPNFQMHYSSARNVTGLRNLSVRVNRVCWVSFTITAPDSQLASCIMDARGYFCFMCQSCEPQRTPPSWFFAVLPLHSEHLRLSPFPISTDPNLDFCFVFFLQEMIIDKVNGQPVPRYLIYDIIKFNVSSATKERIVALGYPVAPGHSVFTFSQLWQGVFFFFLDIRNFVGSVKIYIHL